MHDGECKNPEYPPENLKVQKSKKKIENTLE